MNSRTLLLDPAERAEESYSAVDCLRPLLSGWTVLLGVLGLVLRAWVLRSPVGVLGADEAYTGLQSLGVLDGRFPVVIDGNRYGAALDGYLLAFPLASFGPNIVLLKSISVVFWAVAAVLVFGAAHHLANRRVAALAATLTWIAPGALLTVSTLAYMGYASGMAVSVAVLWFAARAADSDEPDMRSSAVVGALAGLGFYLHPMFIAVLLPVLLPLFVVRRREFRSFWIPFVTGGVVVNLPFLVWNALNGWPSLDVQNERPGTYADRLDSFANLLLPRILGLRDGSFEWIFGRLTGLVVYGLVLCLVVIGTIALHRRSERASRWMIPFALTASWPIMAMFSPLVFAQDGRYGVIVFPFVAIAVAASIVLLEPLSRRISSGLIYAGVSVMWVAVLVLPHAHREYGLDAGDPNASLYELVDFLDAQGIERVAGSYWRVLTVEFATDRDILGAVSPPEPVRFPDRQRVVEATPPEQVAFIFPPWAEDPSKLWMAPVDYERIVVGDTVVYLPLARS
jgi:hypothetical protein